ncbi:unnamed protein product [Orchesella dallaii]|uniref:DBH-like monooxygenase protein 1 n=1 Tax=Orchesella dallaii TaxID=48710 RepID=A0ABP1PHN0_9HEXA
MSAKKRFLFLHYFSLLILVFNVCDEVNSQTHQDDFDLNSNPYRHREILDPNGRYQLEWVVDWIDKRVHFNVTAGTSGYVGFGLSRKGKMGGADIVIGGVDSRGKPYFSDRYAIGNQLPVIDDTQDWILHEALEEDNQTFLSFSRPFDTCDEEHDLPITNDLLTLIWAYGEKDDDILYHFHNRGAYPTYLLDPVLVPNSYRRQEAYPIPVQIEIDTAKLPSDVSVFRIDTNRTMPDDQDTLYMCTFHKSPTTTKRHMFGFGTKFPVESDRRYVHHADLYRCYAPPGTNPDDFFQNAVNSEGSECYLLHRPNPLPTNYCGEIVYAWGMGGKPFFFPEHVGIPMSENGSEYFMLQVHYDNPELISGRQISVALEAYYTNNLRENDVGTMWLGGLADASASVMIPPSSLAHNIFGHCAEGCTKKMFPLEGVSIFATFLHSHFSGRDLRIMHFRGEKELPWVNADDNFNFLFQQTRILNEERKVAPGDSLITRCVYDSTNRNGSALVAGYSTRNEMCLFAIYYYNRVPGYSDCRSEIRTRRYADFIGIENTTFVRELRQTVITAPENYAGMPVETYANEVIDWDIGTRAEIQNLHLSQPQTTTCANAIPRASPLLQSSSAAIQIFVTRQEPPRFFSKTPIISNNASIFQKPKQKFLKKKPILKVLDKVQGVLNNFLGPGYNPLTQSFTSLPSGSTTSSTTTTTSTAPPQTSTVSPPQPVFEVENIAHISVLPRHGLSVKAKATKTHLSPEVHRHKKQLDPIGRYLLEWEVNFSEQKITFNVTVQTKGYVGFGLSRSGKMSGADIIIGGVDQKGRPYFSDRHAILNQTPQLDESQDWILNSASESGNHTFVSFSRPLDTCDEDHDLPITNDLLRIIWAIGETDDENQYHFQYRGSADVYLLDPDFVPPSVRNLDGSINQQNLDEDLKIFRITRKLLLPPQDTVYWASIHKVPTITKQHIVGWNVIISNRTHLPNVHHMLVNRCYAPLGYEPEEVFEEATRSEGAEIYFLADPSNPIPTQYCGEGLFTYAVGSEPIFLPKHVGIPMSENGTEYIMAQIHYDNPNSVGNLEIEVILEAYYTENLREHDGGLFWVGDVSNATTTIVLPPNSQNHVVVGHCPGECTKRMFPEEGINLIGTTLHTHTTGNSVRTLHFRGNKELPWAAADNNFNFNFQAFRMFREEVKVLPGDQLTSRCTYDTTTRNGAVVTGGFSTREEMCSTFFYYYNRVRGYTNCRSEIRTEDYLVDVLGIQNFTFNQPTRKTVITAPPQHFGRSIEEYANTELDFDIQFRKEIQWQHIFQRQVSRCDNVLPEGTSGKDDDGTEFESVLPTGITRYQPEPQCTRK